MNKDEIKNDRQPLPLGAVSGSISHKHLHPDSLLFFNGKIIVVNSIEGKYTVNQDVWFGEVYDEVQLTKCKGVQIEAALLRALGFQIHENYKYADGSVETDRNVFTKENLLLAELRDEPGIFGISIMDKNDTKCVLCFVQFIHEVQNIFIAHFKKGLNVDSFR